MVCGHCLDWAAYPLLIMQMAPGSNGLLHGGFSIGAIEWKLESLNHQLNHEPV